MFLHEEIVISWKSYKHTLIGTSTNHSEIIALYEAARECVGLCRVINHIQISGGIEPIGSPTIIYEDNAACVAQMQSVYVKSNVTKHITPKLFYPYELQSLVRFVSCKPSHTIIWLICSLSHCHTLHFLNVLLI
jgi:hypothetical protein